MKTKETFLKAAGLQDYTNLKLLTTYEYISNGKGSFNKFVTGLYLRNGRRINRAQEK